jgi:hypothetical protein
MTQQYDKFYHTYPVFSHEYGADGSVKRFDTFPTPKTVLDYALMGLPKVFPLTREPITEALVEPFLNSAVTEIELALNCNISPVQHFHSEDTVDGMFESNFSGIRLSKWPATQIIQFQLKFPHTNTAIPYQSYTVPAPWLMLRRNRVNLVASQGALTVNTEQNVALTAGGFFTFATGFSRTGWQPGVIEVVYVAGFEADRLPSVVADLIKTWAAIRFLNDIMPVLFPASSVNKAIDAVSQGVTFSVQQGLAARLQGLEQKKTELTNAFKKGFGVSMKYTFIGA